MIAHPQARALGGGTDLYPSGQHGAGPLIDLTRVGGLRGVVTDGASIRIGAATSWTDILDAPLPRAFDGLKQAARQVGSVQIQNAGTIAGNLCNASPAADGAPPLLTLNAQVELMSAARGSRRLALEDFLKGVRHTALAPDELMTAVIVPQPPANMSSAFEKLGSRTHLVISITMVAVAVARDAAGAVTDVRIAAGSCAPVARRLPDAEAACLGRMPADVQLQAAHFAPLTPIDDVRGPAAFRLHAVQEQCLRALTRACADE